MRDLIIGNIRYRVTGSDFQIALAYAIGSTFVELQQLEFAIVSYMSGLVDDSEALYESSFDVFASKTFGNLIREMEKHDFLKPLAGDMSTVKERRDFFVHKFLFHRHGGELTSDKDYVELIHDATDLGNLFAQTRTKFHDFMLRNAPLMMFAAKRDPSSGELIIVESEFSKSQQV
jgi:hypothetical protein